MIEALCSKTNLKGLGNKFIDEIYRVPDTYKGRGIERGDSDVATKHMSLEEWLETVRSLSIRQACFLL